MISVSKHYVFSIILCFFFTNVDTSQMFCLPSQLGLVFPKEDSATCSPLITYSVKALLLTHTCTQHGVHGAEPPPPSPCNCIWMCAFPGSQRLAEVEEGGLRLMDGESGEVQKKMELDAIITVCLWVAGCFCSRLDLCAYNNSCITL